MRLVFHKKSATENLDDETCEHKHRPFDDLVTAIRSQTESVIQMCQAFAQENPGDAALAIDIELRFTEQLGFLRQLEDTNLTPDQRSAYLSGAHDAIDRVAGVSDDVLSEQATNEDDDAKIISLILSGANESLSDGKTSKEVVLGWLSQNPDAVEAFLSYFSDQGAYQDETGTLHADNVTENELEGWIYDQEDLAAPYEAEFGDQGEEWLVLAKEDEDPDSEEGFLEYRYVDELQAKGSFFNLTKPAALLRRTDNQWEIITMNPGAARLIDLLEEQVELLNE